ALLAPPPGRGLRVVVPPPPGGRARALNAGLAAARGRHVAYLDDDDLYLPRHLEVLAGVLDGEEPCGVAFAAVDQVAQRRGADGSYRDAEVLFTYGRGFDANRILFKNDIPLIAVMHRRDLADAAGGFDEAFDLFEDWDFLIRLSRLTRPRFVPERTAIYRVRDDGSNATTASPWRSPAAEAARAALHAKHAALLTSAAARALVDGFDEEVALREGDLRNLRARLADADGRVAALETELRSVRALAARNLQAAGEREAALTAERDELGRHLAMVHRSLWWRLGKPVWKLRGLLPR
ncbi:MAG TPA: glycosyltransferase, partial [Thermoanaerobaculia bacterium]|nr:glycosyltransferase [Thermoanaerobaculia bacterium]